MSDASARPAAGPKLPPYGLSITNEQAKHVADAALDGHYEVKPVHIAIVSKAAD